MIRTDHWLFIIQMSIILVTDCANLNLLADLIVSNSLIYCASSNRWTCSCCDCTSFSYAVHIPCIRLHAEVITDFSEGNAHAHLCPRCGVDSDADTDVDEST